MPKCTLCDQDKLQEDFRKSSAYNGYKDYCKRCSTSIPVARDKSLEGRLRKIHNSQLARMKRGEVESVDYTSNELVDHFKNNQVYIDVHTYWKTHGFQTMDVPSLDRINDYEPYALYNLEPMTWRDNLARSRADRVSGLNMKANNEVLKINKDGDIVDVYPSQNQASRENNMDIRTMTSLLSYGSERNGYQYFNTVPTPRRTKHNGETIYTVCLRPPVGSKLYNRNVKAYVCEALESDFINKRTIHKGRKT